MDAAVIVADNAPCFRGNVEMWNGVCVCVRVCVCAKHGDERKVRYPSGVYTCDMYLDIRMI